MTKRAAKVLRATLARAGISFARVEDLLLQNDEATVAAALDLESSKVARGTDGVKVTRESGGEYGQDMHQLQALLDRSKDEKSSDGTSFSLAEARALVLRYSVSAFDATDWYGRSLRIVQSATLDEGDDDDDAKVAANTGTGDDGEMVKPRSRSNGGEGVRNDHSSEAIQSWHDGDKAIGQ